MLRHPYFHLLLRSFKGFFRELPMIHSAALSYYVLLAFVPLLYLTFELYGRWVGQESYYAIMEHLLSEYMGIEDISGYSELISALDVSEGNIFLRVSVMMMILFSVTQILNALKTSINKFYGVVPKQKGMKRVFLNGLLFRGLSMFIVLAFTSFIVALYFAEGIFMSLGQKWLYNREIMHHLYLSFLKHLMPILTNFVVLLVIYKFLHDGIIRWAFVIRGASAGAILFYLGQLLLKWYLSNFFFASGAGMAGSILVLMVWIYYSAMIIFLGARFTADFAAFKGCPVQSK